MKSKIIALLLIATPIFAAEHPKSEAAPAAVAKPSLTVAEWEAKVKELETETAKLKEQLSALSRTTQTLLEQRNEYAGKLLDSDFKLKQATQGK
jgi:peptidoglycan hydrolase CwlO-like protein